MAPRKAELEKKQSNIAQLQDQLRKGSNTMSDEAKQKLMREIDPDTKSLNRETEDAQADLDQEQNKIWQELGQRMMAVMDKYAKDNGYTRDPGRQFAADARAVRRRRHRYHAGHYRPVRQERAHHGSIYQIWSGAAGRLHAAQRGHTQTLRNCRSREIEAAVTEPRPSGSGHPPPASEARAACYQSGFVLRFALATVLTAALNPAAALDLTNAAIQLPPALSPREAKAVSLLLEEVEKRSGIRWQTTSGAPVSIEISRATGSAEGYRIQTTAHQVTVAGNDERGILFGIGRLLRELRIARDSIELPDGFAESSAPRYALRGHQLGYRPKSNTYDAWSVPVFEQYIRDLAVFGSNAIELIPPRSDDAADSPHFPLPPMRMMIELSRLLDAYGLDVWIWYPAMDRDYNDAETVASALHEWGEVFRQLPRIDAVFVPGGDPGHTAPAPLLALLARETEVLHRYHPRAQMWVSPQSFGQAWLDEFLGILRTQQPAWLSGVVYGPQTRISLPALRAALPARYPIRLYPDITHNIQCQFPVPDWDPPGRSPKAVKASTRGLKKRRAFSAPWHHHHRLHRLFGRLQRRCE